MGDALPEFGAVRIEADRNHMPRTMLHHARVKTREGTARDDAHFKGTDHALGVRSVHHRHVPGVEFIQPSQQRREAFAFDLVVELGAQGGVCRQRVEALKRRLDVHARASSKDG